RVTGQRLEEGVYVNAPRDAWEQAADRAAERALAGRPASARHAAPAPHAAGAPFIIQRHSSFEHRLLGDAPTAELVAIAQKQPNRNDKLTLERDFLWMWHQNPEQVTEEKIAQKCPWVRTLRLKGSNLLVTYGELNTLPDYLPNQQSLDTTPANILLPILQFVRQEGYLRMNSLLGNTNPPPIPDFPLFQGAVSSFSYTGLASTLFSSKALNDLTANLGIKKSDHYTGLLARNACHFAPFSWYRWQESYLIARNEAQLAYQNRNDSNLRELHTHNAWVAHGYADHFLEDSFAAGHLINKNLVMQWFLEWAGPTWTVSVPPWDLMKRMMSSIQPGLAGRNLYASTWQAGPSNDPQTVEEQRTYAQRVTASRLQADGNTSAEGVYHNNYMAFLNSAVTQSASATLHDYHNEHSLWVSSASQPNAFQVWGDETLLNGGDGVRIASETAHRSQQSILDLLNSGATGTSVQDLANQFPTRVRNSQNQLVDLQTWHDTDQRKLCFETIFDEVHYYVLKAMPYIDNISRDQGDILPDPPPPNQGVDIDPTYYYHLSTEFRGAGMCLDVYSDTDRINMPQLRACGNYSGQYWRIAPSDKPGYYRLTTEFRGAEMCLDVYSDTDRINMPQLRACGGYSGQYWSITPSGQGNYLRLSTLFRGPEMCLDICNGGKYNDMPQLRTCGNFLGQHWLFTKTDKKV
ncbi:MAG: ricin-type beta-trefoil lectin domain protein, partial [Anaerolineales bacterium]